MSTAEFRLWGIDGELTGNENRLQPCLPLFTRAGEEDVVYAARVLNWSPELRDSDVIRIPVAQAGEYGMRLSLDRETSIEPDCYVMVIGPALLANLKLLHLEMSPVVTVQQGFAIAMRLSVVADVLLDMKEALARKTFDAEIATGEVTEVARAALGVMRNLGVGDLRAHLIRTLVAHFLERDVDRYRRVLRLAEVRLGDSADRLEKDVRHHIALARAVSVKVPEMPSQAPPLYWKYVPVPAKQLPVRNFVIAHPAKVTPVSVPFGCYDVECASSIAKELKVINGIRIGSLEKKRTLNAIRIKTSVAKDPTAWIFNEK